jgi:outer membrane immunogenic protein
MRKHILVAAATFALASGTVVGQASAADLFFEPPAPPPPVFVPTWAGFYVGGHIGYGEGTSDYRQDLEFDFDNDDFDASNTFRAGVNPDGILGGVQAGYNWQAGSFVFGLEGDISFTDWSASTTVFDAEFDDVNGLGPGDAYGTASTDIDFLASVRGRVGYAMDSVLIYGTGGIAWAKADARATVAAATRDDLAADPPTETVLRGKGSLNDFGFVAGAGLAWMVIPQTMSVGVEGLYYWFKDSTTLIDSSIDFDQGNILGDLNVRATAELHDAWVIRARADFHF